MGVVLKRELVIKLGIVALAAAFRLGLLYYFLVVQPTDILRDGIEYTLIARGLRVGEPYLIGYLIARPPVFPLIIAAIQSLFGDAPAYVAIANILFSSLTCLAGYDLAKRLGADERISITAALILALDPSLAIVAVFVNAEPLANLLLGLALISIVRVVKEREPAEALWAGLWLALSALTRPTSLYFAAAAVVIFFLLLPRAAWWRYSVIFALLPLAAGLGWTWRNYQTAGVFTFASVADFNMLFYRAVAVEHWATGADPDAIRQRYAWEIEQRVGSGVPREQIDSGYFWYNFAPQEPKRLAAMKDIAVKVYLTYPFWYVATIPIGLYNMFATSVYLPAWQPLEIGLNVVFYLFAMRGLWRAWRAGRRDLVIISLTTILYFIAATLASQTTGMSTRMRSPFTILLALHAAEGIVTR